jgi:hypothetical protein
MFRLQSVVRTKKFPVVLKSTNYQLNARNFSAFERFPQNVGLYNKDLEKDSCGVGLVAQIHKLASRKIVEDANTMLVRMSHRGGSGHEPNSGDGAGQFHSWTFLFIFQI